MNVSHLRLYVVEPIEFHGQTLQPGRAIRITHDSVPGYKAKYGSSVRFWMNWPNKPEVWGHEEVYQEVDESFDPSTEEE